MKYEINGMFCEHANEVPGRCICPVNCYCKSHTCLKETKQETKQETNDMDKNNDLDKPGQFDNRRFEGE